MTLSFRFKLFVLSLVIMAASLALAHAWASHEITEDVLTRTRQDLESSARLLSALLPAPDHPSLGPQVRRLRDHAGVRITVVDQRGTVRADSQVDETRLTAMDNHADRPEVRAAWLRGLGEDVRPSHTLGQTMMYLAVLNTTEPPAVIRVARPLTEVETALQPLRQALLAGALMGLVVAVVLTSMVARWLGQRARDLTGAADAMAAGRLDQRVPETGEDEFVAVARALNTMAASLSETVAALRGERDLLDEVLTAMEEGVLLVAPDRRVTMMNAALRQMLLLPPDVRGRPLTEVLPPGPLLDAVVAMQTRDGPRQVELQWAGLQPRHLQVRGLEVAGAMPGLLVVCVDVTELRRLESVRRDLVANASHELRTPVASVRAATEMLRDAMAKDPEAALRFAGIIERNAERLHRLVSDLLDLSRLDSQQYRLNLEPVDISAVVAQVLALVRVRAEQRRLHCVLEEPDAPRVVTADRRALEQVIVNLVDNVLQHCPPGTRLRIRTEREGGQLLTVVEDNGPGIDAAHLPRVFERFYRVDAGRSREAGGTGLGLSIVKHLVEEMGGRIGVESSPGSGARFWFRLPAA